jgi:hypothetical protein
MATVRKRGKKFEVQIRRKGFNTLCRSFHKRSDADEWGRFMETQADRGALPTPTKVLEQHKVRTIIERYRDEISVKKKSHNTEIYILNAFLRQPLADYSLAEISATDFFKYRERRLSNGLYLGYNGHVIHARHVKTLQGVTVRCDID